MSKAGAWSDLQWKDLQGILLLTHSFDKMLCGLSQVAALIHSVLGVPVFLQADVDTMLSGAAQFTSTTVVPQYQPLQYSWYHVA